MGSSNCQSSGRNLRLCHLEARVADTSTCKEIGTTGTTQAEDPAFETVHRYEASSPRLGAGSWHAASRVWLQPPLIYCIELDVSGRCHCCAQKNNSQHSKTRRLKTMLIRQCRVDLPQARRWLRLQTRPGNDLPYSIERRDAALPKLLRP